MIKNRAPSPSGDNVPSSSAWVTLLRELIRTRKLLKERLSEPEIRIALENLAATAEAAEPDELRLEAVSTLGRASEVSVPIRAAVSPLLERHLHLPLPPVGEWGNADDRFYLAKGISASRARWVKDYAAVELARGDVDERAPRQVWAELAINRSDTLADALGKVASALADQLGSVPDASDTANRKLIRIAEALTETLLTADVPAGEGFGKSLGALALQGGGGKGAETLRVREDAAVAYLELLIQIVRLRFHALLDSNLYRAAGTVRGWWRPARPPDSVERKADRLVQLALEGLHVLARQGIRDKELRQALVVAFGQDRVNNAGRTVGELDPSLPPEVSYWLATGGELPTARANVAVREVNEQATDELIGRLILATQNPDVGPQALRAIADSVEVFEPSQAAVLRLAADRSALVDQWVSAIAAKRRLSATGKRGDIVQYDPLLHESSETLQRSGQARVVSPGVLLTMEGRSQVVIMKAIVEKA